MVKGFADLPLHGGRVPPWLASRMTRLARIVLKLLVEEYGTTGLLERLADPIWFQALNNLIGMDWDSSGSTTVTTGILKQVLAKEDLGVKAAGGKGERSKKTPEELRVICEKFSLDAEKYVTISRLVAKVDNVALQCGYTLYHHMFFVDRDGNWTIVQQGMNVEEKLARRYHWFSGELEDFVRDPHKAISGVKHEYALNTIARRVDDFRKTVVDLVKEKPETLERDLKTILALAQGNSLLTYYKPYDVKEVLTKVKMYRRLGGLK
ncbi:MAG TPA: DUF763 domain-containing protein, partial [Thermoproteales archaeon]|nr:DUF763 domain-containing protein [Thermoproteales archaeon]